MKMKHLLLAAAAALICAVSYAIPARPGAFSYTQPDGSVIRLERHGDEFYHWTTLAGSSQAVELGEDGFWHPVTPDPTVRKAARQSRQAANRFRTARPRTHNSDPMTHGERHIPVLLAAFSDVAFTVDQPADRFTALLNEKGYSTDGGTGSVQDFYVDNSHGAFTPVFDVYGPVTLTHNMAYFGANNSSGNDLRPEQAVIEAAKLLDEVIDFSQYDYDNDGYVDMMLLYYAGYNEAEGGPANSIWPHQWTIPQNIVLDGKRLGDYFTTSELQLGSGSKMCGIGTTSHEFGHSLGLPDFYDTDYNDNGYCSGLYSFSTMCGGSYNNDGRTPPYFNAEERILLGWMTDDDVPYISEGDLSFGSIRDDIAYRSFTDTEGEYFLYECRDGSGWDAPLPQGMVVYHVDKSETRTVGGITPREQWDDWESYNTINAYASHPCFYVVPAANQTSFRYTGYETAIVFPGTSNVTSYEPVDWEGNITGITLTDIAYSDAKVSLNAQVIVDRRVLGTVLDQQKQPVAGVYITLAEVPAQAPMFLSKVMRPRIYECVTDSDGSFSISLDGYESETARLSFSKEGYQTRSVDVTLSPRMTQVSVTLLKEGEAEQKEYKYYNPDAQLYYGGNADYGNSQMAAIRIPADELPTAGGVLLSVEFMPLVQAETYYVVADAGGERLLTYRIPDYTGGEYAYRSFTLPNTLIPAGTDLYVGIAVENATPQYDGYPFLANLGTGHCYFAPFNLLSSSWTQDNQLDLVLSATLGADPGDYPEEKPWTLARMGFNAIADPGNGSYAAGTSFPLELELVEGVTALTATWTFDGEDVSGAKSVSLSEGDHVLIAKLSLSDGTKETLQLVLTVQ